MMHHDLTAPSRRSFLRFLAGSPLLLSFPGCRPAGQGTSGVEAGAEIADPALESAEQAINVFDLRDAAERTLPRAHFAYLQTGVDGDATLRANEAAYARYYLRPRRLVDVSAIDTRVRLFGVEWPTPIVLSPVGSQRAFHADGELATARAAKARGHLQILSTVTSTSVEEVAKARGEPVWYQLYPTGRWDVAQRLLQRAEGAGSPVIVFTVDIPAGTTNRETLARGVRQDRRDCTACHTSPSEDRRRKPMYQGFDLAAEDVPQSRLTWDFIGRLRDATRMKLVLKGIVTAEDAARALQHGVDGIVVSNHGGRAEESGRATLDSLREVAATVKRRIPVLVDGGIRRGTDMLKALAFGADAVCIGRPYIWGLGAFGQAGVERVLTILRKELEVAMQFAGTPTLGAITPALVGVP